MDRPLSRVGAQLEQPGEAALDGVVLNACRIGPPRKRRAWASDRDWDRDLRRSARCFVPTARRRRRSRCPCWRRQAQHQGWDCRRRTAKQSRRVVWRPGRDLLSLRHPDAQRRIAYIFVSTGALQCRNARWMPPPGEGPGQERRLLSNNKQTLTHRSTADPRRRDVVDDRSVPQGS